MDEDYLSYQQELLYRQREIDEAPNRQLVPEPWVHPYGLENSVPGDVPIIEHELPF